jgi:cilia- and flagella-associated protein 251
LIVTADSGIDSMLVVWDSYSGVPKRTYFNPYENGICALDISQDGRYLVTISDDQNQAVSIWDLHNEELNEPFLTTPFKYIKDDRQHLVKFNPSDVYEIVCHGNKQIAFLSWSEEADEIEYYMPIIPPSSFSKKEKHNADLTSTVFIPRSSKAVTATDQGDLLVWNRSLIVDGMAHTDEKRLTKVLELHQDNTAINTLTIHGDYLVTGNKDGSVRFYDFDLKICSWFEDLDLEGIKSISFADQQQVLAIEPEESVNMNDVFKCSDFIVADSNAVVCRLESRIFEELEPENKKGQVIFTGLKSSINCIAVHPEETKLAIGGKSGFIIEWDYMSKIETYRQISHEPRCIEYTPNGEWLLIGNSNGEIEIIGEDKDKDDPNEKQINYSIKASERSNPSIKMLICANDSKHFATMDSDNCVCLFKWDHKYGDVNERVEWVFYGKVRSHEIEITSIAFGESLDENEQTQLRLFSIGKDRVLFEYNVRESSEKKGLKIEDSKTMMIEQESIPTSCIWYPTVDSKEDLLLTVNSSYKMKIWNVTSSQCRKT